MKIFVKVLLLAVPCLACGALGFYLGLGYGAQTLGALVTQNRVGELLGDIRMTAAPLEEKDLASLRASRLYQLQFALSDLGATQDHLAYWSCSARDRETIRDAANFLADHPAPALAPELAKVMGPSIRKGLRFCLDRDQYVREELIPGL